jgi:hypothetical protein
MTEKKNLILECHDYDHGSETFGLQMSLSYGINIIIRLVNLSILLTSSSFDQLLVVYFPILQVFLKFKNTVLPMSTVSSISSNHSTYPINLLNESKDDILPTSLIKSHNSNLFNHDHKSFSNNSQDLFHRLCHQRLRIIQLYDLEIERRQSTSQLITFLNKIDQLINEYESQESTNLNIGNPVKKLTTKSFYIYSFLDDTTNTTKHLDDVLYSTYFHGKEYKKKFFDK